MMDDFFQFITKVVKRITGSIQACFPRKSKSRQQPKPRKWLVAKTCSYQRHGQKIVLEYLRFGQERKKENNMLVIGVNKTDYKKLHTAKPSRHSRFPVCILPTEQQLQEWAKFVKTHQKHAVPDKRLVYWTPAEFEYLQTVYPFRITKWAVKTPTERREKT